MKRAAAVVAACVLVSAAAVPSSAASGVITTIAGGFPAGAPGTGVAISPAGVTFDAAGNLYAADAAAGVIWRLSPDGAADVVAGAGLPCSLEFSYYEAAPECRSSVSEPVVARDVALNDPAALTFGPDGALYFSERRTHVVRRLDLATGLMTVVAGTGDRGYVADHDGGPATAAWLHQPAGLAFDSGGNLYIADHGNQRIRKVSPSGTITTVAGCGERAFPACFGDVMDGAPIEGTELPYPTALAVGPDDRLYVVAYGAIAVVDQDQQIYRLVGGRMRGWASTPNEGENVPAAAARFGHLLAMDFAANGDLYLVDAWFNRIRRIPAPVSPDAIVEHVAGCYCGQASDSDRRNGFNGDGRPARQTAFALARATRGDGGIAVDGDGNLYLGDVHNHRVRRIDARTGLVSTVLGNGERTSHGRMYVPMELQPAVVQGGFSGDGGPATAAQLFAPSDVVADRAGNVYVLERYAGRVRRIAPDGSIATLAGAPCHSYVCSRRGTVKDGGPATDAVFDAPTHLALDATGTQLYIGDTYHFRVRQVNLSDRPVTVYPLSQAPITIAPGAIATIAGDGQGCSLQNPTCYSSGGFATATSFSLLQGVAVDGAGNVYVADASAHVIRRVDARTGIVTTIVGGPGRESTPGCTSAQEGLPGAATFLCGPTDLAIGPDGDLYVAETGVGFTVSRSRIRKVDLSTPLFVSTVVAGNGSLGYGGDGGAARDATLAIPHGIAVAPDGALYIADTGNSRIRRVGVDGTITTVAGSGRYVGAPGWPSPGIVDGCALRGDGGPPAEASLCGPTGVAVGADGTLYVADQVNNRVRAVEGS